MKAVVVNWAFIQRDVISNRNMQRTGAITSSLRNKLKDALRINFNFVEQLAILDPVSILFSTPLYVTPVPPSSLTPPPPPHLLFSTHRHH